MREFGRKVGLVAVYVIGLPVCAVVAFGIGLALRASY